MLEYIETNSKKFEVISQKRDVDNEVIDRALKIVHNYIIRKRLIVFGGFAIDAALRLKGSQIYPDEERPDYDFMSPDSIKDAYELADILVTAGFNKVNVIRAIHVQTMRVRVDFVYVADINYTPQEVFDKIPTLNYQHMLIVHPNYQRMDMHLAFCFPYNSPPREDIFNRWKKDLTRFNLFEKYYPIESMLSKKPIRKTITTSLKVPVANVALHGFVAYALMKKELHEADGPHIDISLNSISVNIPLGDKIYIVSHKPDDVIDYTTHNYPYMDIIPESYSNDTTVVLSTKYKLLSVSNVKGLKIASAQYLLLHFLFLSLFENEPDYLFYYNDTLRMIEKAKTTMSSEEFQLSIFGIPTTVLGDVNYNHSYLVRIANIIDKVGDSYPPYIDEEYKNLALLPKGYYPPNIKPEVNYDHVLFQRSGKKYFKDLGKNILKA